MGKRMNTIELKADAKELLEYIEQLCADLVDAPPEIKESALDYIDISPELVCFEFRVTSGSVVTALLKPTQRLLDFGHAIRTRDFDSPAVEPHDEPLDEQDPLVGLMPGQTWRLPPKRTSRLNQTEAMAEMKNCDKKQIANRHHSLLYALFICEDGTIGLTIFDADNTATINLGKDMAEGLVENINQYIRLLK
jgi:hypothetical protein